MNDDFQKTANRTYLCGMSRSEAEFVIENYEKALVDKSSLPCSIGRIRLAYLAYISATIEKGGDFSKHSLGELVQEYITIGPFSKEEPYASTLEIGDFISECKKYRAESDQMEKL